MDGAPLKDLNLSNRKNSLDEVRVVNDSTIDEDEYNSLLHRNEGILLLHFFKHFKILLFFSFL